MVYACVMHCSSTFRYSSSSSSSSSRGSSARRLHEPPFPSSINTATHFHPARRQPPGLYRRAAVARSANSECEAGSPLQLSPPDSPEASVLPPGKCWLAGVGPGSWEHVTVKVVKLITQAEVVVYDDLGAQELIAAAPAWAEKLYVGKRGGASSIKQHEIDRLLVQLCQQGKRVVRLKGGCPSTFSRVSSEAAALRAAGCQYEMVPGLSTATAAAVLAGFPLTDAKLAGAYAVVTAHDAATVNWAAFSQIPTLVILMGGRQLPAIVQQLLATGWANDTPAAVIKDAGTTNQQTWLSSLATIVSDTQGAAPLSPCIIVVGQVAGLPAAWSQLAP